MGEFLAYFRNDVINRINLHFAIQALAQGGGAVFFLVFLVRTGLSAPEAFLAQAAILAGRFFVRPAILPLTKRWGLKPLLIIGTLLVACRYPLLADVHGIDRSLVLLCAITALGEVFYWPTYHAYFAAVGDEENRGHQIGVREALVSAIGVIAPLLGAWALVAMGPGWTFPLVGAIQAAAALPLLGAPGVAVRKDAEGALRAARFGMTLFIIEGWFSGCYVLIWQVALFITLKQNYASYGGAMAIAAVSGAVGGMILGRNLDLGHGQRAVLLAYGLASGVVALRAASVGLPWLALIANAPGPLVTALVTPVMMTAVYNLAKASPCPLRFHLATERGWDLGCFLALLTAAALISLGLPLSAPVLLALPSTALAVLLLRRYYAEQRRLKLELDPGAAPIT